MDGSKSRQLKIALCGLAALGMLSVTQGCSSSNNSGAGGSTGAGGSGTAGKGSGGSTTTGGGGSTGGGGGAKGCNSTNTMTAPTSGLIADFVSDASAGIEIMGGIATFGGTAAPGATFNSGALNISENQAAMAMPQYVGTVLYFSGCIDASAFTGVQFTISGTMTGCTLQYSANDSEHGDSTGTDTKASGPMGAYPPQLTVGTPFTSPLTVPFTGTGSPTGGMPAVSASAPFDPAKLTGLQWQFTIPAASDAGPASCMANLTIDDIKFVK